MNEVATIECKSEMVAPLTAQAMRVQVNLIQEIMNEVMQGPSKDNPNGIHYGIIPGCGDKPTLFKAGAEKLSLTFRLRPVMGDGDIDVIDLGNGHREYRIRCHILNINGLEMATGVGSASTMESKHRYRDTRRKCPKCGAETIIKGKEEYGGGWLCYAKKGGCGAKFADEYKEITSQKAGKEENTDIADVYNTVLKMAKKRAYVDGILSATACSDIFTQDIEDLPIANIIVPTKEEKADTPKRTPPQRLSATAEPTQAELEAKAAEAKAKYASEQEKSATDDTEGPTNDTPLAIGLVMYATEPNKGGFVSFAIDGYQKESGKDIMFSSKDKAVIEKMKEAIQNETKVSISYIQNDNPNYANSITEVK